eukprot:scaffold129400_cov15-Tisochrysis_lutea.AAC.1
MQSSTLWHACTREGLLGNSASRENGDARVAWALRTAVARVVASHINAFRQAAVACLQLHVLGLPVGACVGLVVAPYMPDSNTCLFYTGGCGVPGAALPGAPERARMACSGVPAVWARARRGAC